MIVVEIRPKAESGVSIGAWSAAVTADGAALKVTGAEPMTTRNRMDLSAVLAGLSALKRRCAVEIYTDSEYLLRGALAWFPLRLNLGWTDDSKRIRIRNEVLWSQLQAVAARHDIQWHGPRGQRAGSAEFAGILPEYTTEVWGRTPGDGTDVGHVYSDAVPPWSESLGEYRAFTDDEMRDEVVCSNVCTNPDASQTLTSKQKYARGKVIASICRRLHSADIKPGVGKALAKIQAAVGGQVAPRDVPATEPASVTRIPVPAPVFRAFLHSLTSLQTTTSPCTKPNQ